MKFEEIKKILEQSKKLHEEACNDFLINKQAEHINKIKIGEDGDVEVFELMDTEITDENIKLFGLIGGKLFAAFMYEYYNYGLCEKELQIAEKLFDNLSLKVDVYKLEFLFLSNKYSGEKEIYFYDLIMKAPISMAKELIKDYRMHFNTKPKKYTRRIYQ